MKVSEVSPASLLAASILPLLFTGCIHPARDTYVREFHCKTETTRLVRLGAGRYQVNGCAGQATYVCVGEGIAARCAMEQMPSSRRAMTSAPVASEHSSRQNIGHVKRGKGADGTALIALDLTLDRAAKLSLRAAPERHPDVVQLELSQPSARSTKLESCELMMMVNAQKVSIPSATAVDGQRYVEMLRVRLPRELAFDMGGVEQMALRACEQRWTLSPDQLALVREFVAKLQEELAWLGDEKQGSARLSAPAGGWPGWEPIAVTMPPEHGARDLPGDQLFALVSPSVHEVEVKLAAGDAQGSGVAVGEHSLLTNCHVVAGALSIQVRSGETMYPATLVKADPASDRCVLELADLKLKPVHGFRKFSDLKVGEVAYTVGTPRGLEKTLGSGNVSGLRHMDEQPFIQTSAPVSSGSSGGGLFDARGNLIGITTWVRADTRGVTQSLNFAIPADRFLTSR